MLVVLASALVAAAIAQPQPAAAAAVRDAVTPTMKVKAGPSGASAKKGAPAAPRPAPPPLPPPLCAGDYADALPAEAATRALEPRGDPFIFAIRNIATYEHVYYGRDGKLRKGYLRSVVHGTGFGLRVVNGETLIVTNEHVASRPDVTDDEHHVEGVPPGSKKVREQLKIVRDESDDYEPGHTALLKVLADPAADIAMLKAKKVLPAMPYRLGRSSALRAGNLVQVRGFPLGVFAATNSGKVVNPYTVDTDKAWQHADFVIDALLSGGNSGSPVFAVSCRTGEPELVGVFHAGFTEAPALNVVVAIDQLREELETLKVPKRDLATKSEITASDRDRVVQQLFADQTHKLIFPFGARAVQVQLADPETLRFAVLDEDFPLANGEALGLIDRARNGFGTLDAVLLSVDGAQPAEVPAGALDPDAHDHFERLYDSLWHQLIAVIEYRAAVGKQRLSADAYADAQTARARLNRKVQEQKELLGLVFYDNDRSGVAPLRMAGADGGGPQALQAQAPQGAQAQGPRDAGAPRVQLAQPGAAPGAGPTPSAPGSKPEQVPPAAVRE